MQNETGRPFQSALKGGWWNAIRGVSATLSHNEGFVYYQIGYRCADPRRPVGLLQLRRNRIRIVLAHASKRYRSARSIRSSKSHGASVRFGHPVRRRSAFSSVTKSSVVMFT